MPKEYSIYFDKRKIVITTRVAEYFDNEMGLFIRHKSSQEISKILEFFQSTTLIENVFIYGENVQAIFEDFSRNFKLIRASGGLVQNDKGEYLFIYRYGKWDLPKGKLEADEAIENAAIREVTEETGVSRLTLDKHLIDTYHTYKQGNITILKETHWFLMKCNGSEPLIPQTEEDISIANWVAVNRLDQILDNTYDTIRQVLNAKEII